MKEIMIQVNQFAPDDATDFQKETDFVLKKSNYLNLETGISWHLKCCESISTFFAKIVDLRTVLLINDILKHLKPRSVCHLGAKYRLYLSCFDVFLSKNDLEGKHYPNTTTILLVNNRNQDLRLRLNDIGAMRETENKYKVLEDFIPIDQSGDELGVKAEEYVNVLKKDICGWWFAQNENGESGWLPANFLEEKMKDKNDEKLDAGELGKFFIALEA